MKAFSLLKLYLLVVSLAGIIGMVIGYGTLLSTAIRYRRIDDKEYIQGQNDRELRQCEEPRVLPEKPNLPPVKPTEKEIAACKEKITEKLIIQRKVITKENTLSGLVRGSVFLILFATHFPQFRKKSQE